MTRLMRRRCCHSFLLGLWLFACILHMTTSFVPSHPSNKGFPRHGTASTVLHVQTFRQPTVDTTTEKTSQQKRTTKQPKEQHDEKERNLYDVLGAAQNATRAELKQRYVVLARKTHPDAMIGNIAESSENLPSFAEIAAAWRVLSDRQQRQRYDRELRAKAFSASVEKLAAEMGQRTVPVAVRAIEQWAVPVFVKTATTTIASVSAAADDLGNNGDFGSAIKAAIKAGRRAVRAVDKHLLLGSKE